MLTAKEMLLDFINLIFTIVLIGVCILYFIAGDNFENFKNIVRSLAPLAVLGIILMIRLKFWQEAGKKAIKENTGETEILITLGDKIKMDLFVFSLPTAIILVEFALNKGVSGADIVAAALIFVMAFLFERWLLKKGR